jgi:hypothetical protein
MDVNKYESDEKKVRHVENDSDIDDSCTPEDMKALDAELVASAAEDNSHSFANER